MTDLSKMSDEELLGLYQQGKQQRDTGFVAPPRATPDRMAARQEYGQDVQQLRKDREAWAALAPTIQAVDRFGELNREQGTGGIGQVLLKDRNIFGQQDPELAEMLGIGSVMQTHGVPQGQGAVSNFERELFARGTPSIKNVGNVNANIRGQMKGVYQQEGDRLAFYEAYLARNGTLNGAAESWHGYVQANPYIRTTKTQSGDDRVDANTSRKDWREYFGAQQPGRGAAAQTGPVTFRTPAGTVTVRAR